MATLALIGAGRIGRAHARAVAGLDGARLAAVHDPNADAAASIAEPLGARVMDCDAIFADPTIDAVILASPTDLHATQIELAARAGKAIFCEKPIDLDLDRVRACLAVVRETGAPLMVGFNRRFDPSFAALHAAVRDGAVGRVEMVQITSRDPAPPPLDYVRRSGGLFRDMMIHDFDMARWLLGEDPVSVQATGAALVDPAIGDAGDVDSAAATLRTASGKIAVITNSRRATYGYDQRIEAHGAEGMIAADNPRPTTVMRGDGAGFRGDPLMDFFMERYEQAYARELAAFVAALKSGDAMTPSGEDGLRALALADAAVESHTTGRAVQPALS